MRRLYSEHVPLGEVQQPGLLRLLAERDVELAVALFPRDVAALRPLHEAVRRAGVRLVLWPLLPDALGRWPSGANGAAFADHVDALVAETEGAATVLFDVEPPIAWTRFPAATPRL